MREKSVCFTGHRVLPSEERASLEEKLDREIRRLIVLGAENFFIGGALGFDTMAARCVIRLREASPHIRLFLVFPCREQTSGWNKKDIAVYEEIKKCCDSYLYLQERYSKDCMFIRNRYLVDNSSYCICYLKQKRGGTFYTVNYAGRRGLEIINLSE